MKKNAILTGLLLTCVAALVVADGFGPSSIFKTVTTGTLEVDGVATFNDTAIFNQSVQCGTFQGPAGNGQLVLTPGASVFFDGGYDVDGITPRDIQMTFRNYNIFTANGIDNTPTDGGNFTVIGGHGGQASGSAMGGMGGGFSVVGGNGGGSDPNSGDGSGGNGGPVSLIAGDGGDYQGDGSVINGNGGDATIEAGASGGGGLEVGGTNGIAKINTTHHGITVIGGVADLSSHKIVNVSDPSSAQDAATKAYVDAHMLNAGRTVNFLNNGNQYFLGGGHHLIRVWGIRTNTAATDVYLWLTNDITHTVDIVGGVTEPAMTNYFSLFITASPVDSIELTNKFTPAANVGVKILGSEDVTY